MPSNSMSSSVEHWPLLPQKPRSLSIVRDKHFRLDAGVQISHNDTLDFLRSVPNETFQLIVTSPPYNLGKPYEKRQEFLDYLALQKRVVNECVRALRKGGSL